MTARRGGCVIKKISRSHRNRRSRGGFPLAPIGKPPRPRFQRMLRGIFLIARPPILAVMQGGESPHATCPSHPDITAPHATCSYLNTQHLTQLVRISTETSAQT